MTGIVVTYCTFAGLLLPGTPDHSDPEGTPPIVWMKEVDPPLETQMRVFLPEWCLDAKVSQARADAVGAENLPLVIAIREQIYPLLPLPPAMQSVAALGISAFVLRVYRRFRRQLRSC